MIPYFGHNGAKQPVAHPNSYHYFADNFLSSVNLVESIGKAGHKYTGTLRINRLGSCPAPDTKHFQTQPRGHIICHSTNTDGGLITVYHWKDKKIVTMVSNASGASPTTTTTQHDSKEKQRVTVQQPCSVSMYNKSMGWVDRMDQNIAQCRYSIRGRVVLASDSPLHWYDGAPSLATLPSLRLSPTWPVGVLYWAYLVKCHFPESLLAPASYYHWFVVMENITMSLKYWLWCRLCHTSTTTKCVKCNVGVYM